MHHSGTGSAGFPAPRHHGSALAHARTGACTHLVTTAPWPVTDITATGTGGSGGAALAAGPPPHDAGGPCTAKLGFDSDLQGANIRRRCAAFTAVAVTDTHTYCGAGALAITASFSGTNGPTTKGAAELPVDDARQYFSGKTLTVHVSALPGCSTDLGFAVLLTTAARKRSHPHRAPDRCRVAGADRHPPQRRRRRVVGAHGDQPCRRFHLRATRGRSTSTTSTFASAPPSK